MYHCGAGPLHGSLLEAHHVLAIPLHGALLDVVSALDGGGVVGINLHLRWWLIHHQLGSDLTFGLVLCGWHTSSIELVDSLSRRGGG